MYCMEYLVDNVDWLEEEIGTDFEDEYVVIDCPGMCSSCGYIHGGMLHAPAHHTWPVITNPGQIELYTHSPVMTQLVRALTDRLHFRVCVVYLLEAQFINDVSKYFSGTLTAMAAMVQLELPHINVLSKMDLVEGRPGELQKLPNVKDGEQSDERNGEKVATLEGMRGARTNSRSSFTPPFFC